MHVTTTFYPAEPEEHYVRRRRIINIFSEVKKMFVVFGGIVKKIIWSHPDSDAYACVIFRHRESFPSTLAIR